ncbi:MAG: DUF6029 family protein [Calditrichota bacterium]
MNKPNLSWGIYLLLGVTLLSPAARALELRLTGQNEARYARGRQPGSLDANYHYFENYLELDAGLDPLRLHLRQSYRLPSEYGRRSSGLDAFDKRYIEYAKDDVLLRGGNFYRTWGRGLLLGVIEVLELNFDSGLDGLLMEVSQGDWEASAFRGVEADSAGEFREQGEGFRLSKRLPMGIRLGAAAVHLDKGPRHPDLNRTGGELEKEFDQGSLFLAYVADKLDRDVDRYHNAFYGAGSIYGDGWALFGEYHNYRLFTYRDPGQPSGFADQPSLQYPPTGSPESTMHLLDRHPRLSHFNDETGLQVEANFNREDWTLLMNYSQSSEQDKDGVIPRLKEEYSPYRGVFAHLERNPYEGDRLALQGGWQEDVEFTATSAGGYSVWFQRVAAGGIYERRLDDSWTLAGDLQVLKVIDRSRDYHFWEDFLGVTLTRSPWGSLTAMIERSLNRSEVGGLDWVGDDGAGMRYWPSVETTLKIKDNHQVRLFVGHERGGLRCSGGVCRFVNPFKGVKLTVTSQF